MRACGQVDMQCCLLCAWRCDGGEGGEGGGVGWGGGSAETLRAGDGPVATEPTKTHTHTHTHTHVHTHMYTHTCAHVHTLSSPFPHPAFPLSSYPYLLVGGPADWQTCGAVVSGGLDESAASPDCLRAQGVMVDFPRAINVYFVGSSTLFAVRGVRGVRFADLLCAWEMCGCVGGMGLSRRVEAKHVGGSTEASGRGVYGGGSCPFLPAPTSSCLQPFPPLPAIPNLTYRLPACLPACLPARRPAWAPPAPARWAAAPSCPCGWPGTTWT